MSLRKFIEVNSKRMIGTSLLLSLMAVQSVGAAGTISDEIVSKGNIEYDANNDGTADVYFYSNDLQSIATGIESLNTNVTTLQQSFTELGNKTEQYKANIISGLNSNVYAKANISPDATFEQVIEKIYNIPAPTTAVGNVYSSGDNSGLGITANGQSINIDGVTSLNLAVNEAITLPSGYYPNDITFKNNIKDQGANEVLLDAEHKSYTFPAGYYGEHKVYTTLDLEGNVKYTIMHKHCPSCYPEPTYTQAVRLDHGTNPHSNDEHTATLYDYHYYVDITCDVCGQKFTASKGYQTSDKHKGEKASDWSSSDKNAVKYSALNKYNKHLVDGRCPSSSLICGKSEGEQVVTDIGSLGQGDTVIKAEILYEQP